VSLSPIKFTPEQTVQELVDLNRKVLNGIETLGRIREEDIQVGVSAKEAVYREDKVILYHYTPLVEQRFAI
jgi:polyhydroxyalkanoate synthase